AFVPTGALRLLTALQTRLPQHFLIAADFDFFPPPELREPVRLELLAANAPLVAGFDSDAGRPVDFPTYLAVPGSADILFPTDFPRLARMYAAACGRPPTAVRVMKQREFVQRHGGAVLDRTRTAGGYNPLLEDFSNAAFLLS
ncbi:unnamed protein product, partial [Phaeothamnion confervicola]